MQYLKLLRLIRMKLRSEINRIPETISRVLGGNTILGERRITVFKEQGITTHHYIISGCSDCPYYARAELLGDKLSINLPDFKLHKIVKTPEEWKVNDCTLL